MTLMLIRYAVGEITQPLSFLDIVSLFFLTPQILQPTYLRLMSKTLTHIFKFIKFK